MNQSQKPDSILEKPGRTIRSRSLFMFICCLMVACVLVGRLIYLQIIKYEDYRRLVIEQMVQETSISASRGAITDRNGVVIATNYTTERIFIDPSAMVDEEGNFSEEIRVTVAQGLSEKQALPLITKTIIGSAKMIEQSALTPAEEIKRVCSPGGTTLEAMKVFEEADFEGIVMRAMMECSRRADEITASLME